MTSEDERDPSKYDDTHLSTHDLLERIPKSKNVQENAWYDLYGDMKPRAIKANVPVTDNNSVGSDIWENAKEDLFFDAEHEYEFDNIQDAYKEFYYGNQHYNHDNSFTNI